MAEESDKEQLQQSGINRTAHALYASGSIYAASKVGVAMKIQILVRPKPDQPDCLLRPCLPHNDQLQRITPFSDHQSYPTLYSNDNVVSLILAYINIACLKQNFLCVIKSLQTI